MVPHSSEVPGHWSPSSMASLSCLLAPCRACPPQPPINLDYCRSCGPNAKHVAARTPRAPTIGNMLRASKKPARQPSTTWLRAGKRLAAADHTRELQTVATRKHTHGKPTYLHTYIPTCSETPSTRAPVATGHAFLDQRGNWRQLRSAPSPARLRIGRCILAAAR